jgi:predicted DNA-binding protein (UPF0251 family)
MDRREFLTLAEDTALTTRQAEAFWARHVAAMSREEAGEQLDTSPSNVDNLERAARQKMIHARNLMRVVESVGGIDVDGRPAIGTCAECDLGSPDFQPHPDDEVDEDGYGEVRMVCPQCYDEMVTG